MRAGDAEGVVSIVVPCLDEEAAVGGVVRALLAAGLDEVVVVDGGSRDGTAARAAAAGARVMVERRRGYGRACSTGAAAARPDAVVIAFVDGDGSDRVELAGEVIGPVLAGRADLVLGSRLRGPREPGSLGAAQVAAGRIAGLMLRALYGLRSTDMGPFRAIARPALDGLGMAEMSFGWNVEMQMRAAARGLRVLEVPVGCRRRVGGVSKVSGRLGPTLRASVVLVRTVLRLAATLRGPHA
ncbi:glycosyltransferase family 2 protein [Lichenibacterium dinghuense]|uniref:glycosyltransferase family 2 protein n=1 Tax=Lichenibacterium dinghuense TaxID=2895977 RepID=UPI001F4144B9|nr:glycosyltransferase family 2 protein [Lichenibacterium sp. 6Y81]